MNPDEETIRRFTEMFRMQEAAKHATTSSQDNPASVDIDQAKPLTTLRGNGEETNSSIEDTGL